MFRPIEILLVEDNPADVRLTREVLKDGKVRNRLTVVGDGQEALALLAKSESQLPDVVLIDASLPGCDGLELAARMRGSPRLADIPIVLLTGSQLEKEAAASRGRGVVATVVKPMDLRQLVEVVRAIDRFFLAVVTTPVR